MYVYVTLVVIGVVSIGWVWWLDAAMGGGSREDDTGLIGLDTAFDATDAADYVRPTAISFRRDTPTVTRTPTPRSVRPSPTATRVRRTVVPVLTNTPTPTLTFTPRPSLTPTPAGEQVFIRLARYWPDEGPDWCLTWDEESERCVSPLTSGDDFRTLDGQALACDPEWLGHTLVIPDLDLALPCLDIGISFQCEGGPCDVGLLASENVITEGLYAAFVMP